MSSNMVYLLDNSGFRYSSHASKHNSASLNSNKYSCRKKSALTGKDTSTSYSTPSYSTAINKRGYQLRNSAYRRSYAFSWRRSVRKDLRVRPIIFSKFGDSRAFAQLLPLKSLGCKVESYERSATKTPHLWIPFAGCSYFISIELQLHGIPTPILLTSPGETRWNCSLFLKH
jgi:hypothetical protein